MGPSRRCLVRRLTAIVLVSILGALGCARDDDLVEISWFAQWNDVTARVWIPTDEPRSIGTYRAEVTWPDGVTDRIESERDGMIANVWLADLESDGAVDLVVALASAGSGSYGSVHVYRHQDDDFVSVPIAGLEAAGYMGHDVFSVEGGRLYRTFPTYAEGDPNAAPTGGDVRLRYSFGENAWVAATGPGD
jgi:hypothetical protein